jgi:hypothetical protein
VGAVAAGGMRLVIVDATARHCHRNVCAVLADMCLHMGPNHMQLGRTRWHCKPHVYLRRILHGLVHRFAHKDPCRKDLECIGSDVAIDHMHHFHMRPR